MPDQPDDHPDAVDAPTADTPAADAPGPARDPAPDRTARSGEGPYGEHGWGDQQQGAPGAWASRGAQGGGAWATTGAAGEDHPRTTIAFVLSLVALVFVVLLFWLIIPPLLAIPMAIVGIVFGVQARKDMRAEPGRYRNQGLATAAVVLGWITLGLIVVGIVLVVLVIAIFSVSFSEVWNDPQFQEQFLDEMQRQSLRLPI